MSNDKPLKPKQKRNTSGLIPFKKGESGNPNGARMHDKDMKVLRNLTKKELTDLGNIVLKNDVKSLKEILDLGARIAKGVQTKTDKKLSVVKLMVASIAHRIIKQGDMDAFDKLLNRLIGKVKDEVDFNGNNINPPQLVIMLPDNGRAKK